MKARIAREAVLDRENGTVTIDGHLFPYYIGADVSVEVRENEQPMLTLSVFVDRVQVITSDAPVVEYAFPWPDAPLEAAIS